MIDTLPVRLIARILLPASWMVALALLVKGHSETGDGFSAALIGGAGLLIQLLVLGRERIERVLSLKYADVLWGVGLAVLLGTGFGPLFFGHPPLTHFPRPEGEPISLGAVELTTGFAIEFGIFLVVLGTLLSMMDVLARTSEADAEAAEEGPA